MDNEFRDRSGRGRIRWADRPEAAPCAAPGWSVILLALGAVAVATWGLRLARPDANPAAATSLPPPPARTSRPHAAPCPLSAVLVAVPPWTSPGAAQGPALHATPAPVHAPAAVELPEPTAADESARLAEIHHAFCRRAETDPQAGLQEALHDLSGVERAAAVSGLFSLWMEKAPGLAAEQVDRIPAGPARDAAVAEVVCYARDLDPASAWQWLLVGSRALLLALGPTVLERWSLHAPTQARDAVVQLALAPADEAALLSFVSETEAEQTQKES